MAPPIEPHLLGPAVSNETPLASSASIPTSLCLETLLGDQAQPSGAVTLILGAPANQPLPMDDHLHVTYNSYCTDIHGFDDEEGDDQLGLSQSIRMLFMISLLPVIRASFLLILRIDILLWPRI